MPYLPSSSARLIFCGPDPPDPPLAGSDPDLCEDDPFTPFAPVAPPPAPFTAVVVAAAVGAGAGAGVGLTLAPPRAVGTGAKSNRSSSRSTFFACEAAGLDAADGAGAGGAEAAVGAGAAGADLTEAAARAAAAAASSRSALMMRSHAARSCSSVTAFTFAMISACGSGTSSTSGSRVPADPAPAPPGSNFTRAARPEASDASARRGLRVDPDSPPAAASPPGVAFAVFAVPFFAVFAVRSSAAASAAAAARTRDCGSRLFFPPAPAGLGGGAVATAAGAPAAGAGSAAGAAGCVGTGSSSSTAAGDASPGSARVRARHRSSAHECLQLPFGAAGLGFLPGVVLCCTNGGFVAAGQSHVASIHDPSNADAPVGGSSSLRRDGDPHADEVPICLFAPDARAGDRSVLVDAHGRGVELVLAVDLGGCPPVRRVQGDPLRMERGVGIGRRGTVGQRRCC